MGLARSAPALRERDTSARSDRRRGRPGRCRRRRERSADARGPARSGDRRHRSTLGDRVRRTRTRRRRSALGSAGDRDRRAGRRVRSGISGDRRCDLAGRPRTCLGLVRRCQRLRHADVRRRSPAPATTDSNRPAATTTAAPSRPSPRSAPGSSCEPRTPTAREPRPAGRRRLARTRSGSAGGEPLPPRREHPRVDLAHRERHRAGAPDVPGRAGDGGPAASSTTATASRIGRPCSGPTRRWSCRMPRASSPTTPRSCWVRRSPPSSRSRAPRSATRARCPTRIRPASRPGELRLVVSLRSIGEGHVSSITFCEAIVGPGRAWRFVERRLPLVAADIADGEWDVTHLQHALEHAGQMSELGRAVIRKLPARFVTSEIERRDPRAARLVPDPPRRARPAGGDPHRWTIRLPRPLPRQRAQLSACCSRRRTRNARAWRTPGSCSSIADDGETEYRATYTAYDGRSIASRLLITRDFVSFAVHRLTGAGARNKGMALFPRRIGARLVRADPQRRREHLDLTIAGRARVGGRRAGLHARSDSGRSCRAATAARRSRRIAAGSCSRTGSDRLRHYAIGAILLDLDDPRRVVGVLEACAAGADG